MNESLNLPENKEERRPTNDIDRSQNDESAPLSFAAWLDIVAVVSLAAGVGAALCLSDIEHEPALATMYAIGGIFAALWWHCAAIRLKACDTYLKS